LLKAGAFEESRQVTGDAGAAAQVQGFEQRQMRGQVLRRKETH
jgi:hypothetical protein